MKRNAFTLYAFDNTTSLTSLRLSYTPSLDQRPRHESSLSEIQVITEIYGSHDLFIQPPFAWKNLNNSNQLDPVSCTQVEV